MHSELLFQLSDFSLKTLKQEFRVLLDVDNSLVAYFHHTSCELKCGNSLFIVIRLRVDVSNHYSLTIASDRIL